MKQKDRGRNANNVKPIIIIALLILTALLVSTSVLAIGITPSKRIVQFKPGEKLTYGIDVVNNGQEELDVTVYARGELKDQVKLSTQKLSMGADDKSKHVNVEFTMPDKIDVAGPHEVDIVAVGSTPAPEGVSSAIKADLAVISKLLVEVPYPDKYAEARIHVLDTETGRPVQVNIPVFNKGSVPLSEVYAKIEVYDKDGEKIDSFQTDKRAIAAGEHQVRGAGQQRILHRKLQGSRTRPLRRPADRGIHRIHSR